MAAPINLLEFPDRASASEAAAGLIAESIRASLALREKCSLVVSGGSTPGPCFDSLSMMPLEWSKVTVIPSDERWVPPNHLDSNERLVRDRLLVNDASAARFLPLFREGIQPDDSISLINHDLSAPGMRPACALLGMGEDGHFASLFPDFDGLRQALNPDSEERCLTVKTSSSPHLRISLSLAFLLNSEATVLLIFGAEKRRVLEAAAAGGTAYPVESLLSQSDGSMTVLWAP